MAATTTLNARGKRGDDQDRKELSWLPMGDEISDHGFADGFFTHHSSHASAGCLGREARVVDVRHAIRALHAAPVSARPRPRSSLMAQSHGPSSVPLRPIDAGRSLEIVIDQRVTIADRRAVRCRHCRVEPLYAYDRISPIPAGTGQRSATSRRREAPDPSDRAGLRVDRNPAILTPLHHVVLQPRHAGLRRWPGPSGRGTTAVKAEIPNLKRIDRASDGEGRPRPASQRPSSAREREAKNYVKQSVSDAKQKVATSSPR